MKIFAATVFAMACLLIYLSHKNQNLLPHPLTKVYRHMAWLMALIAVGILGYCLPWLVAIFMSIVIAIVVWTFAPFISALKRYSAYENEKSSKNPS